jgi:hypothetical protein
VSSSLWHGARQLTMSFSHRGNLKLQSESGKAMRDIAGLKLEREKSLR